MRESYLILATIYIFLTCAVLAHFKLGKRAGPSKEHMRNEHIFADFWKCFVFLTSDKVTIRKLSPGNVNDGEQTKEDGGETWRRRLCLKYTKLYKK